MMRIDRLGIWYANGSACWIWPWKRHLSGGWPVYDLEFNGVFKSEKDRQREWEIYRTQAHLRD